MILQRTSIWLSVCGILVSSAGRAEVVTSGLLLHLDAATQIERGGKTAQNSSWANMAPGASDSVALPHLSEQANGFSWSGNGLPHDPFALSFDGRQGYATGALNLERRDITLEVWARVDDVKQGVAARGATLVGNDFGVGGLSLLVARDGAPVVLHDREFSRVDAQLPLRKWTQFVLAVRGDQAVVYANGVPVGYVAAARAREPHAQDGFQMGTARLPDMDYVAADGLIGAMAIVRVYDRCLTPAEIVANFEHDRTRFALPACPAQRPVTSLPAPPTPGLPASPTLRSVKWDYAEHPVQASGTLWAVGMPGQSLAQAAFDGYPSLVTQPYPHNQWRTDPAKRGERLFVTISYPQPVAVTRFVHYFDESPPTPAAWRDLDIQVSDDLLEWRTIQQLRDAPALSPQVLGIDRPVVAQFYRIEIKTLAANCPAIVTNEIETWYGATIGNVATEGAAIQAEPCTLKVRVSSLDGPLHDARLVVRTTDGAPISESEAVVPDPAHGGVATATVTVTPRTAGYVPLTLELHLHDALIDERPFVLDVTPKLTLLNVAPAGASIVAQGDRVTLTGVVANQGQQIARNAQLRWCDQSADLGTIEPGKNVPFELTQWADAGYHEGLVVATADDLVRTELRRAVLAPGEPAWVDVFGNGRVQYTIASPAIAWTASVTGNDKPMRGRWHLLADDQPCPLVAVPTSDNRWSLAAVLPHGVFIMSPTLADGDLQWHCQVVPDEPCLTVATWANLELRLAVENPDIMFRPHLDWYTAAHGANFPQLLNGHHSATRMLCVQTGGSTVSLVPDTDNLLWGFTADHAMTARFTVPMHAADARRASWRPINESPDRFALTVPIRAGDWWAAYEHVVRDIFRFEQPRQWAMPISQMQMLTTRELMSAQAWSEKHQIVRCLSDDSAFWTFYATAYSTPALYQWYLATDNETARIKAEKMIDWLLRVQHQEGPMRGAWFSAYFDQGPDKPELLGGDFIRNRWLIAHATGAVVKTLLWYDRASGGRDPRVLAAARQGCDWLLTTMREDGGWPYAFDLEGHAITDACGAGQIWNTWALWRMYQATGEQKYRQAAAKSKEFFEKTYMDAHRYVGYWEDTVGITKEENKTIRSWEAYEPAVATLVFTEMRDDNLALAAARDVAAWSWTRVTSTRHYETCYGQTTEQATCGPSQAQGPMVALAFHAVYEKTGQTFWSDLSGAVKAVNFCADPDQEYGMVATSGWCIPQFAVAGPPYENTRPFVSPNMRRGDYGRQLWTGWCTDQFAWLSLEWLMREANLRAPEYVQVDPETLRGTVLGEPGRVKMPEERCDLMGLEHHDFNWVGYQNDQRYVLLVMNHKEPLTVTVRAREAHLGVYTRPPQVLVGAGAAFHRADAAAEGINWRVDIPAGGTVLLIWDRLR